MRYIPMISDPEVQWAEIFLAFTYSQYQGGVAEWFKAPVLKTGFPQGNVGSNPTPSANIQGSII